MPDFPVVDSHVHLFDTGRLSYSWLTRCPGINHPHLIEDYLAAASDILIEKIVFAEVWVDPPLHFDEAAWASEEAARNPIIAGMIASAPLEKGRSIAADLDKLQTLPTFRAVRRITEAESDPAFCARPDFVSAVQLLGERDIVCDVCVFHHQLPGVIDLARHCPQTQFVLDHLGKPPIRIGELDPWRQHLREVARLPNVACKISGMLTEADQQTWTRAAFLPYLDHALDCFGFDRVLFGSDWPVLSLTTTVADWVDIVDEFTRGCSADEAKQLYRDNATRIYKL